MQYQFSSIAYLLRHGDLHWNAISKKALQHHWNWSVIPHAHRLHRLFDDALNGIEYSTHRLNRN